MQIRRILSVALVLAVLFRAHPAAAASVSTRKAIIVGKAALYGLGGGLVVGLASQVFKKRTKNIFVGGSLGMYAGILTGVYLVMSAGGKDDSTDYEGPDTYEDFTGWDSMVTPPARESQHAMLPREQKFELKLFERSF